MTTPTTPLPRSRALLALLLAAGLALSARAQTAPVGSAATAANAKEEAVLLSPFEVRTDNDVGYTAASALAGGRTDSPLKLTSASISVMTSQFLDDIGSTNFRSAGEWALNWVPQLDVNTATAGGFQINYRNMGASFASRNYFLWYVESDSYNTERYEFARGPNGVLFGDGGPGGISTTWTKRPRFDRPANGVNFRLDSYSGWRSTIDLNRPVTKNFALRLNALAENSPATATTTTTSAKACTSPAPTVSRARRRFASRVSSACRTARSTRATTSTKPPIGTAPRPTTV